ncbi:hypothetical protein J2W17_005826 [Pseudomonas lini]|nr:hypothetical protein [Pseudomonas lini]
MLPVRLSRTALFCNWVKVSASYFQRYANTLWADLLPMVTAQLYALNG